MASGTLPGQRKFSGLLFKRIHSPHRSPRLGNRLWVKEKARLAGSGGRVEWDKKEPLGCL